MVKTMMRILAIVVLSMAGGTALTWYSMVGAERFGKVTVSGWIAYPEAGTPEADPYDKARRARDATLSLGAAEGVTFFAEQDRDGLTLTGSCDYQLVGMSPPTRFWTLQTTNPENVSADAAQTTLPVSLHSGQIAYGDKDALLIEISATAKPGNWLAIPAAGTFTLAFTLYDSPIATNKGLIDTVLPQIVKGSCHD